MIKHEEGFTIITYAEGKRPLKLAVYVIDCVEREVYLRRIVKFIEAAANTPIHISKMEQPKFFALVERLATMVCRQFSPTANWGVTKPEIRGAVLFVLYGGIAAGTWPDTYEITDTTFVQYGESDG
jgi:hypothetical protein